MRHAAHGDGTDRMNGRRFRHGGPEEVQTAGRSQAPSSASTRSCAGRRCHAAGTSRRSRRRRTWRRRYGPSSGRCA